MRRPTSEEMLPGAPSAETGVPDAELLKRFVTNNDEAAFELLVWRHGPLVLSTCRRLLRDEHDAEDAFQAAFLTLSRKAGSIDRRESISAWLYQVAYRISLRLRRTRSALPLDEMSSPVCENDPSAQLTTQELQSVLHAEVNRLPEKYRKVFILCYLNGKTNEAAARELGCPKGTVLSRLARARERLRERLEQRGFGAASVAAVLAQNLPTLLEMSPVLIKGALSLALLGPIARAAGAVTSPAVALAESAIEQMHRAQLLRQARRFVTVCFLAVAVVAVLWLIVPGVYGAFADNPPAAGGCH